MCVCVCGAQSCPALCDPMDYTPPVPHQAPLSMEFSRQEYWSRLPFPPPGNLPTQEIEPHLPSLLHWQVDWLVSKKDTPPPVFPQNTKHLLCQSASDLSFIFTFPFQLQGTAAWYTKLKIHILSKQFKVFCFSISEKGNNRNQTYISLKKCLKSKRIELLHIIYKRKNILKLGKNPTKKI